MLVETDAALMETHLETCAECAAMLANREALRGRVRGAVLNADVPPDLGHRVQSAIAKAGPPRRVLTGNFGKPLLAIAAALTITAGAYYFWPSTEAPPPNETQQQFIARLSSEVPPIMRVGLRQHVHCGVLREYPPNAPTLAELAHQKAVSAALIDAIESHAPAGMHVVMAHVCSYEGRQYLHVVARGDGHLMSLLITARGSGEELAGDLKAIATQVDTDFFATQAKSGTEVFVVDAFETKGYLVFLVSDIASTANLKAFEAMAPQVRAALI
jgi:anti-sigma factor RsiW